MAKISILFVCLGNICRSPMAEYYMKALVEKEGLDWAFHIKSAATSREEEGNGIYPPARRELQKHGITCSAHRARQLTAAEVAGEYERNTGLVIAELFRDLDPEAVPAVLVSRHGPFTWGKNCVKSVENALILEETARMALITEQLAGGRIDSAPQYLQDKHYFRKHGAGAYYGQKEN